MKSEGVKEIVKWMQAELQQQKIRVKQAKRERSTLGYFEDCCQSYEDRCVREEAKLDQMVSWKISTEKYMKKLQYEEQGW